MNIQQTALMKRNHDFNKIKAESNRLAMEKESLKRILGTYKEKISLITMVNKNVVNRSKT